MKLRKEFEHLRDWKKTVYLLYADGIDVDDGGLFKGSWNPSSGGGFGGEGIARTTYRQDFVTGDVLEQYVSKEGRERPDMIGFSHAKGAMQQWPFEEVFED